MVEKTSPRVLIIGAGIAGLMAARSLEADGIRVRVIEKGRGVGGRIATRRLSDGQPYDHGALRFSSEDGPAGSPVSVWEAEGLVARDAGGEGLRWRIVGPATRLPKRLAEGLDVETGVHAVAIRRHADTVEMALGDGRLVSASAAILTCPVPQTLALLDAGGLTSEVPKPLLAELRGVTYEPGLVLLLRVDRRLDALPKGALVEFRNGGAVSRIFENAATGTGPSRLSIYARGAFARDAFDRPDTDIVTALLDAACDGLPPLRGAVVVESELKRWRYARAERPVAELAPGLARRGAPVVLCGDAFGPPPPSAKEAAEGIARAVRSGLAAAASIVAEIHPEGPAAERVRSERRF